MLVEDSKVVQQMYRNKLTLKLPFELTGLKLKPYFADEVFINFDSDTITRNRFYSGVAFTVARNLDAELFYLWQSSRKSGEWLDIHVLGSSLKLIF